ncbi:PPE family protein [Mycobacterium sp. ML4]
MSFLVASPEVTSTQMHTGAGSAPMYSAAAAWDGLAAELDSAAGSFSSLIRQVTTSAWQGESSRAMTEVALSYTQWLAGAATQAGGAATGAKAVAALFEEARAAVVHPIEVRMNRVRLLALARANIFGLAAPAIAANECEYEEMWAKDVAAMLGYHGGASAIAQQLAPWQNALKGLTSQISAATGAGAAALPPAPAATAVEYGLIAALISVAAIPAVSGLADNVGRTLNAVSAAIAPAARAATTAATTLAATANAAVAPVAKALADTPVVAAANAALAPVTTQVAAAVAGATQAANAVIDQAGRTIGVVQNAALGSQLALFATDPALLSQFVSGALGNPALLNSLVPILANNPALVTSIFGLLASNPQLVTGLIAQVQSNPALAAQLLGAFTQLQATNPALAAQLVTLATQLANQLGIGQVA